MTAIDYVVRAARQSDLAAFVEMKKLAGPGLTSLAGPDDQLAAHLAGSVRAFAGAQDEKHFFLALEHTPTHAIVGMAQVKAEIGVGKPFFNYRILRLAQASAAAKRRFDLDLLMLVNEFAGCTEIGSLFVRSDHRRAGVGRTLARARYMLMALAPERFGPRVVAELRGMVSADGQSPFWNCLGRPFFHMSFEEADQLSATTDNQFIVDLMPKYPVYVALLPTDAREAIGQTHPDGHGARRLLEQEGFRYDGVIDIFDGGPVMSAPRETIDTVRRARVEAVRSGASDGAALGLLASANLADFRVIAGPIENGPEHAHTSAAALSALGLHEGGRALVCPPA